jgi:hypothetical protein
MEKDKIELGGIFAQGLLCKNSLLKKGENTYFAAFAK